MVLIVASVHKIYHFQFLHICCALSVRGTYLTPISLCRTIFPSLSLSICSSHWSPWVGPTGINSLPPGLSCFMRASGMGWAAAPTCIASYGASIKFTKVIFKTWIGWKNENVYCVAKQQNCDDTQKRNFQKGSFLGVVGATVGYILYYSVDILFSVSSIDCDNSFGDLTAVCNTKKLSNNGM